MKIGSVCELYCIMEECTSICIIHLMKAKVKRMNMTIGLYNFYSLVRDNVDGIALKVKNLKGADNGIRVFITFVTIITYYILDLGGDL